MRRLQLQGGLGALEHENGRASFDGPSWRGEAAGLSCVEGCSAAQLRMTGSQLEKEGRKRKGKKWQWRRDQCPAAGMYAAAKPYSHESAGAAGTLR